MRTYRVRIKRKKQTAAQEQAWRGDMIAAINAAHGYPLDCLQVMSTGKLVTLRNRIGNRAVTRGRLPVDRHNAKLMG